MSKKFPLVLDPNSLEKAVQFYRSENKKIVFTNGCFDLLHVGHVRYLTEAASLGDILIVGINSDASVKKLKGSARPVQNENDRAEILASLKSVDHTVLFSEDTPLELIRRIEPNVLVKGGDWTADKIVGSDLVLARGGQVLSLQFVDGKSTTKIIEKSKS
jgi:rfaE bifunctional protein nucleotidyltransferase chain/domain